MSTAEHLAPRIALVVDDEATNRLLLRAQLKKLGYEIVEAENGREAVERFQQNDQISIVFMDVMMPFMDGLEATRTIKACAGNRFVPVIFLTAMEDDRALKDCVKAGGDDFMKKPFDKLILQAKVHIMERISNLNHEVRGMYSLLHREQEVAEQFFNNAVQKTNLDNPHLQQIIRPAGIFSGDMFLSAYSPSGNLHVLLGDFTGHGLTAALGALPVSEVFRAMTHKGFSSEAILEAINKKMNSMLPPGMFLAAYLVSINASLDYIKVFNCGMQDLLVLNGQDNGIKQRVKSNGLPLGIINKIEAREVVQYIAIDPADKVLMLSDGVVEARNADEEEYGWERLQQAIDQASREENLFVQILDHLDDFCGDVTQADDVSVAEVDCVAELFPTLTHDSATHTALSGQTTEEDWALVMSFQGQRLRRLNPVPILINNLIEIELPEQHRQALYTVLTELFVNALDHGVLGLESSMKANASGFAAYFAEREKRLQELNHGTVTFSLTIARQDQSHSLTIRVEDSGMGFDTTQVMQKSPQNALSGRGLLLMQELCDSVTHLGKGNITEVVYSWQD